MSDRICTCMVYDPRDMLVMWNARAKPIIARLIAHGHRVKSAHMAETLRLAMLIDRGLPETVSAANCRRSHHLPGCPVKGRTDTVSIVRGPSEATATV